MLEIKANLFYPEQDVDGICITTNKTIKNDQRLVMGAGIAFYAAKLWPSIPYILAKEIKEKGNNVYYLGQKRCLNNHLCAIFSFPVKNNWWEKANLFIIERSCKQLIEIVNNEQYRKIWLIRPGCDNGKLNWEKQVKPIISSLLDNRFIIVNF